MTNTEDFLAHFGVRGMKWGQRKNRSAENLAVSGLRKNRAHTLSDAELKQAIGRMKLEKQYRELNPKGFSKGYKIALGLLAVGTTINTAIAYKDTAFGRAIKDGVQKAFNIIKNR